MPKSGLRGGGVKAEARRMTNGLGAFLGGMTSGWVVDHFTVNGVKEWTSIWLAFAGYALILGVIFPIVFRYRHDPEQATPGRA